MADVRPKKALGQHFLTDRSVADRIAATLDAFVGMPVLEIGPGTGMLTRPLLSRGHDVTVIELDQESVDWLHNNMPELNGCRPDSSQRIIAGDFLQMNLDGLFDGADFCVTGNYPYNISSQIFFKVLDYKDGIRCCTGMLQREVAERLAAPPGTKARGILSVLLQAWYNVEYLFTVSENVFNPPPKVKSGVIRMVRRPEVTALGCDEALFKTVVKTTFGMRRKTLRNSVKSLLPPGKPLDGPEAALLLTLRPEQLSVDQFITLTNLIARRRAEAN